MSFKQRVIYDDTKINEAREIIFSKVNISEYLVKQGLVHHDRDSGKLCCPMHDEKTPSFSYTGGKCNCFGCNKGGTVIELHYAIKQRVYPDMTYSQAIYEIANMFDIEIPKLTKTADNYRNRKQPEKLKLRRRNKERKVSKQVKENYILNAWKSSKNMKDLEKRLLIANQLNNLFLRTSDVDTVYDTVRKTINNYNKEVRKEYFNN